MGSRRKLLAIASSLFLLNTLAAYAATEAYPLRIRILSAETHPINDGTQVPRDCDFANYSAYCNESRNPTSQSIMVVQDDRGNDYRITCTADSRFSKCSTLPVGNTFEARKDKHGITILFRNTKGKETRQLYQLVATIPASRSSIAAAPPSSANAPVPTPSPAVALQKSPVPAPVVSSTEVLPQPLQTRVKCNFTSTPAGAEITVDGRYVGNTPSEIGLTTGSHVVILSLPGFAQWKRDLAVATDSVVNVTATLQKSQP